jgi:hypothetical protein
VLALGDRHRHGQQLADAVERHAALLVGVEHLRELLDGGEHGREVEHEREQRADLQAALAHQVGPRPQHEDGGHVGQQLHEREVGGGDQGGVDAGGPVLAGDRAEPGHVALLAGEGLGHPHARDALGQVGVHRRDPVPHLPVGLGAAAPEPHGGDDQRRHHRQHHERQIDVHRREDDDGADERDQLDQGVDEPALEQ